MELRAAVGQTEMLLLLSSVTLSLFAASGLMLLVFGLAGVGELRGGPYWAAAVEGMGLGSIFLPSFLLPLLCQSRLERFRLHGPSFSLSLPKPAFYPSSATVRHMPPPAPVEVVTSGGTAAPTDVSLFRPRPYRLPPLQTLKVPQPHFSQTSPLPPLPNSISD